MDQEHIRALLTAVAGGGMTVDEAMAALRTAPVEELGFARPDYHRALRQGVGEVIYGGGKTPEQVSKITGALLGQGQKTVLITRMSPQAAETVAAAWPLRYHEVGHIGVAGAEPSGEGVGKIVVASGGTSDMEVAEEAALTAEVLGNRVERLYDVGVAGIHRLLGHARSLLDARVVIAVAGMEGALTSVIGGLVDCPVIGLPTSVGYGASFGGVTALLAMLNSCASGVGVVNIDNGFGAGFLASRINHMGEKP